MEKNTSLEKADSRMEKKIAHHDAGFLEIHQANMLYVQNQLLISWSADLMLEKTLFSDSMKNKNPKLTQVL